MTSDKTLLILGVFGIVCAAISLLFIPIIFGPAAIVLGYYTRKKGESTFGLVVIILGAVFIVIGMILGAMIAMLPYMVNSTG